MDVSSSPDLATSLHRRSYCGVGRNPRTSKLRINVSRRFMDLRGHTSTMGSNGYWETTGGNFGLRSSGRFGK
jgi:hypothetical protein